MELEPKVTITIEGDTLSANISVSMTMGKIMDKTKNGFTFNGNSAEKVKRKVDIALDEILQNIIELQNAVHK